MAARRRCVRPPVTLTLRPRQALAAVRILPYLHISHAGIYGLDYGLEVGESENLRLMNPAAAIDVVEANRDLIVGMKVRVGRYSSGDRAWRRLTLRFRLPPTRAFP